MLRPPSRTAGQVGPREGRDEAGIKGYDSDRLLFNDVISPIS
jgi:hypothetical protein